MRDFSPRLVATDRRGAEHRASREVEAASRGVRMREAEFDLPLEDVEELRFQTRPIEAVEFKDVHLAPRPAAKSRREPQQSGRRP